MRGGMDGPLNRWPCYRDAGPRRTYDMGGTWPRSKKWRCHGKSGVYIAARLGNGKRCRQCRHDEHTGRSPRRRALAITRGIMQGTMLTPQALDAMAGTARLLGHWRRRGCQLVPLGRAYLPARCVEEDPRGECFYLYGDSSW